jgi:hypothetical protein
VIRYTLNTTASIGIEQFEAAPTVYLDHWALRLLSEDKVLGDEFIALITSRTATLMLSWLNLIEFTQVEDARAHSHAEGLVERLLPNIFFLEINPFTVIARENELLASRPGSSPHADSGFLNEFSMLGSSSLTGFASTGLFTPMHQSSAKTGLTELADLIVQRLELQRSELTGNITFQKVIRRPPAGPPLRRGTRYVFRELARTFLVEKTLKLTRNHAIDLLHAVVPVSYCDYVLLDAHWEVQIDRVSKRFAHARMNVPLANVYSKKSQGVARFLKALSAHDS